MEKKTVVVIKTENSFDITEHAYSIPKFEFDSDIKSLQMQEEMANLAASTITNTTDIKIEPIEDEIEEDQPELIQLADVVKEESYLIDEEVSIKDESDKQNSEALETLAQVSNNTTATKNHSIKKMSKAITIQLPHKCTICHFQALCEADMIKHKNEYHGIKDEEKTLFHCDKCEFKTTTQSVLSEHLMNQHAPKSCKSMKLIKKFECTTCPYKSVSAEQLKFHLNQVHKINLLKCTFCTFSTKNSTEYAKHVQSVHKVTASVCDLCDFFTTFYQNSLARHKTRHILPNGQYRCTLCRNILQTKFELRQHVLLYHKKRSDQLVGNYTPNDLQSYVKKRTKGESKQEVNKTKILYKCALCSFRTKYKFILTRHMLKHVEDNNSLPEAPATVNDPLSSPPASTSSTKLLYKCYTCHRSFSHKKNLMLHVKTHWKIHFKCNLCPYQSLSEHEMSTHVQVNHDNNIKEEVT